MIKKFKITEGTKLKSYIEISRKIGKRQYEVLVALSSLSFFGNTANEIAQAMKTFGYVKDFNRNNSQPRLNELVKKGKVEVVGKRKCSISGKTCAVYQLVKEGK